MKAPQKRKGTARVNNAQKEKGGKEERTTE